MITIHVNGETQEVAVDTTVAGLIELFHLQNHAIAVEHNAQIVRKSDYSTTKLNQGDRLEIVTFVGGG